VERAKHAPAASPTTASPRQHRLRGRGSVLVVWGDEGEGRNEPRTRRMGAGTEWNDKRAERAKLSARSSWGGDGEVFGGTSGRGRQSGEQGRGGTGERAWPWPLCTPSFAS
jgi:hypothetical protein